MAIDIIGYWEGLNTETQEWDIITPVATDRSYIWFGLIGGVRCEFDPQLFLKNGFASLPHNRGLPSDINNQTSCVLTDSVSTHSHNWLTQSEVSICLQLWFKLIPLENQTSIVNTIIPIYNRRMFTQVRMVFGFKNA